MILVHEISGGWKLHLGAKQVLLDSCARTTADEQHLKQFDQGCYHALGSGTPLLGFLS